MEELLCQENCAPSVGTERKKKRKHDSSQKGDGNDVSESTPSAVDSAGASLATSTSDPFYEGDSLLSELKKKTKDKEEEEEEEEKKKKKKKKKKRREKEDGDVIEAINRNDVTNGTPSVVNSGGAALANSTSDLLHEDAPLLSESKKTRKEKREEKKKRREKQDGDIIESDNKNDIPEDTPLAVDSGGAALASSTSDLSHEDAPLLNESKKLRKQKREEKKKKRREKQDGDVIEADDKNDISEDTPSAVDSGGAALANSTSDLLHEDAPFLSESKTKRKEKKEEKKKKRREKQDADVIKADNKNDILEDTPSAVDSGGAALANSTSDLLHEDAPFLCESKKKRKGKKEEKKKRRREKQDIDVIEVDTNAMCVEGPYFLSRDSNDCAEPVVDSNIPVANGKKERKRNKKEKKNKVEQATEATVDPDNTDIPAEGPDFVMQDSNENTEPVSNSKKKNKKKKVKKQEEELIVQHNSNEAAGADSAPQELNETTEANKELNKSRKKKKKKKKQNLELTIPNDGCESAEGPLPLSQQSIAKSEPISESNDSLLEKRRRGGKRRKTEVTGSRDSDAPDRVLSSVSQIAEMDFGNNGKCSWTSCHQNGALEEAAPCLEKNQNPASPVLVALANLSIEAPTNCLDGKAGIRDCLGNLRLCDQQQGTPPVISVENSSTLEIRDQKDNGALEIAEELASQVVAECSAVNSCHRGALIAGAEADSKELNPSASDVVVSADIVMETIKEDKPQSILDSLSRANNAQVSRKKLLILDLNGLLVDVVPTRGRQKPDMMLSRKYVYRRPFVKDFLDFCFERFAVAIWSSRMKRNIDPLVGFLFGRSKRKLVFCWDQSHCTKTEFTTIENREKPLVLKELKRVWEKLERGLPWEKGEYNESNTLLLDDSPYKALRNPEYSTIFPYSYKHNMMEDNSLGPGGDLRVYLENLASAENVQEYVKQNPFGQRPISKTDSSWHFYEKILEEVPPLGKRPRVSRWDR